RPVRRACSRRHRRDRGLSTRLHDAWPVHRAQGSADVRLGRRLDEAQLSVNRSWIIERAKDERAGRSHEGRPVAMDAWNDLSTDANGHPPTTTERALNVAGR